MKYNTLEGAFVSGVRLALHDLILTFTKFAPLNTEQEKVLTAVGIRYSCNFDRGMEYNTYIEALHKISRDILTEKWEDVDNNAT